MVPDLPKRPRPNRKLAASRLARVVPSPGLEGSGPLSACSLQLPSTQRPTKLQLPLSACSLQKRPPRPAKPAPGRPRAAQEFPIDLERVCCFVFRSTWGVCADSCSIRIWASVLLRVPIDFGRVCCCLVFSKQMFGASLGSNKLSKTTGWGFAGIIFFYFTNSFYVKSY